MIPQTCKFKGRKFECGLSISCILGGGKPMDLCSGGMIWSCCVDEEVHPASNPNQGAIKNASKLKFSFRDSLFFWSAPNYSSNYPNYNNNNGNNRNNTFNLHLSIYCCAFHFVTIRVRRDWRKVSLCYIALLRRVCKKRNKCARVAFCMFHKVPLCVSFIVN